MVKQSKDYMRDYWKKNGKKVSEQRRTALFEVLGSPVCVRCGFNDLRALQIDHINGGGSKERRENPGHYSLLKKVREKPQDFQILCANCNWIKRVENKEARGKPNY